MPADTTDILDIRDVTVKLGGRPVLHDIEWRVDPGQNWFVIGANGCGKTTLVNVILAHVWPQIGGTVTVLGRRYGRTDIREVRRQIGWISPYLRDWTNQHDIVRNIVLSGFDASIGLYRKPRPEEFKRVDALLQETGCAHFAERSYAALSSGEQMKVLIARATVRSPRLLVMDEPCSHLDMGAREEFLSALDVLAAAEQPPSIIMVSHRIEEITPLFAHGLIMKEGRVIASGPKADVLTGALLGQAFDLPVTLHEIGGRFVAARTSVLPADNRQRS